MKSRRIFIVSTALLLLIGGGAALYLWNASDASDTEHASAPPSSDTPTIPPEEVVDRAWAFYQSRPYFQRPRPPSEVPAGLPDTRAATCGGCHVEIYEEWKLSTHRRAWLDDAQFMAELEKSRGEAHQDGTLPKDEAHQQNDVGWMCVNCHTPSIKQLPELVVGLQDGQINRPIYAKNPTFDPVFQKEAISCATCHVRDGVVYGPFGDTDAPHATAKDPALLTPDSCTSCHNAVATFPAQNLGCFFTTGEEWGTSDYAETDQSCQSCHMPQVERKLAGAFDRPPRMTRRHWFGGSLIPKKPAFADELEPLKKIYGSGVDIELRAPVKGAESSGEPDPDFSADSTRCAPHAPQEDCLRLWVRLSNRNAGHKFPTGDPERHADFEIRATDAQGTVLAKARDRIASRYQWWPSIERLTDNRILPGEHHDILLEIPLGADAEEKKPITVEIKAHKYRMYEEAFEHHELQGEYVRGRLFHTSTWRVSPGAPDPTLTLITVSDDAGTRDTLRDTPTP